MNHDSAETVRITAPNETPTGRQARPSGRRLWDLVVHALLQVRQLRKPYAALMHGLLFWGVTVQLVGTAINLMQMKLFTPFELTAPRGNAYLTYEVLMEWAGIAILVGVVMAGYRRAVQRPKALESRWDDWYALGLLALVALAGFSLEGTRLFATQPAWASYTPVGAAVARAYRAAGLTVPQAVSLHLYLFWLHAALGLLFLASIPFTKLRHLVVTPLNILLRPARPAGVLEPIVDLENAETFGAGTVSELPAVQLLALDACLRCGRCEENCPASLSGMTLSPRRVVVGLRDIMADALYHRRLPPDTPLLNGRVAADVPWQCTTCGACILACPAFVNPVDSIIELRRYQTMTTGDVPQQVADTLRNIERHSNPWGLPADDRPRLVSELDVRQLAPGDRCQVLVFLGCAATYDERNRKVARAMLRLLQMDGTDVGVLAGGESCCGDTARRLGHEYLFQVLAEQNATRLAEVAFERIVTACPHCYHILRHEYPQLGYRFPVEHLTQYLAARPSGPAPAQSPNGRRIAYHDSCYLGRYNQIYAAPRALLDRLGMRRVELARHGATSFCCGGGGGQMWQETDPATRINQRRLDEAIAAGVDTVATACPYCLLMFDDAVRSRGLTEQMQVLDIAEMLAQAQ